MLCSALYSLQETAPTFTTAKALVTDRITRNVSFLKPQIDSEACRLDYRQFSMSGEQQLQKTLEMQGFAEGEFNGIHDRLFLLLNEALAGYEGALRKESWLSIYPVDPANPEAVLYEESYKIIQRMQKLFAEAGRLPDQL